MAHLPPRPLVRDLWSLPPIARSFYVPPSVADDLPSTHFLTRLNPLGGGTNWVDAPTTACAWPRGGASAYSVEIGNRRLAALAVGVSSNSVRIAQSRALVPTNVWEGVCALPLGPGHTLPVVGSPFAAPLSGAFRNVTVATTDLRTNHPPRLRVVFSTAPLTRPVETWYDEALTFEWEWQAVTTACLRTYARSYSLGNGMPVDAPGVLLGEWTSTATSNITLRIDAARLTLSAGTNAVLDVDHGLSPFAWRHGLCLALQAEVCPAPIEYRLDQIELAGPSAP
jgi:hypothetical protein